MSSKTKTTATKEEAKPALVPKLRFPEFRGAEGWSKLKLGSAAFFYNGRAYKQEELLERGKYKVLRVGNFFTNNNWYYSDLELEDEKYCEEGDLLYAWSASFGPRVWKQGKTIYHYHIWKVVQREGVDKAFLFITLEHQTERMKVESANGLGLLHITKGTIESWEASFPKVPEQQKIAECLSSLDELMAAQARKVDALKNHKKGLMQQLFPREGETQPRLRFPEFQNVGEWEEKKLGSVCDIQRGKFSHRPRNDPRFFGGPYPFIQTGDVVKSEGGAVVASQSLNEEGLAVSKLFKPTIVLITIAANIGDTGLLLTEGCFTDSVVGLIPPKDVIPVFLELIMRGQKENLNKVATTGAQKNINNEILREVSVLLPSVPEQQRIASCLSSLDTLITAETQKLEALKTHKKGLMQQLFPSPEEVEA